MRLSAVKYLAIAQALVVFVFVRHAFAVAQVNPVAAQPTALSPTEYKSMSEEDKKSYGNYVRSITQGCPSGTKDDGTGTCKEDCSDDAKAIADAETEMTQKCTESGLGGNCITMVQKCMSAEQIGASDKGWLQQLMPMAGQLTGGNSMLSSAAGAMGNMNSSSPKGCGNMPAKDYFDEKSKLEREIRDAQNELTDLDKDINDEQKSVNDKMKDAQKESNDAQKEFNEKKLDISKEKRDSAKDLQDKQNDQAKNLMDMNTKMMQKRSDVSAYERTYTQQLIQLTDNSGKLDCLVKVKKLRDEVTKAGIYSGSGGTAGIAQGNSQSATLKGAWNECMASFFAKRDALTQERVQYMQTAQNELANIQTGIDEGNQSMSSYLQQHQETMNDLTQKTTDAQTNAMNQVKTAQQSVQLAQQTMQQKQQALQKKQGQINLRISSLNQDIAKLGPVPQAGAKTGWTDAQDKVVTYLNKSSQFKKDHCDGKRTTCGDSKSKGLCSRLGDGSQLDKDKKAMDAAQKKRTDRQQQNLEKSIGE